MKKANKYLNTAIIDADYILWIACNPNKVLENGVPLKKDGKFVYVDKTVQEAIATCDAYITDILNFTHSDSYILYLTTGKTFRHSLDSTYKANRIGTAKPLWFNEVKQHMISEWGAVEVPGLEADDLAVITKNSLEDCFIIAADKDILECVPGKHFDARKTKNTFIETSEKDAEFAFAKSILTGDSIDGIPNIEKGYGPKTAEAELAADMQFHNVNPVLAAYNIYTRKFGIYEGTNRFYRQFSLLKIIDSINSVPNGIEFTIPEPNCWNCVEALLTDYTLKYSIDL